MSSYSGRNTLRLIRDCINQHCYPTVGVKQTCSRKRLEYFPPMMIKPLLPDHQPEDCQREVSMIFCSQPPDPTTLHKKEAEIRSRTCFSKVESAGFGCAMQSAKATSSRVRLGTYRLTGETFQRFRVHALSLLSHSTV